MRNVPVTRIALNDGEALVASVFDLLCANYGARSRPRRRHLRESYDDDRALYAGLGRRRSPACRAIRSSRSRANLPHNAEKTDGRSMVIVGAGLNHWYHMDMNYRGIINMLVMCGCVGQSGGGWSHYVGQEKLRPQTGWMPLAFGARLGRPPRQMNGTSLFYAHTDQWRYETLDVIGDPVADAAGRSVGRRADRLQRARRAHGLVAVRAAAASNPADVCRRAAAAGLEPKDYVAKA